MMLARILTKLDKISYAQCCILKNPDQLQFTAQNRICCTRVRVIESINRASTIITQKAGHFQKAETYYTAILRQQPDHPDANHNMGVLAYTIGQVDKAITFLENAIKSNPNIAQYWLTYINILIEQNRMDKANRAFEKAVEKGVTRDPFREIKQKLGKLGFSKKSQKVIPIPLST